MTSLSLDSINSIAPYQVTQSDKPFLFKFVSDFGIEFGVGFEKDELLRSSHVCQFAITNYEGKKSPRDNKVRETILAIVEEFFAKNQSALLYICETGDGKQMMRGRLFTYWFELYEQNDEFLMLPLSVCDEEGNENFAALIIRKDNPDFAHIVTEFTELTNLVNQPKPKS